jgi:hypothetical protein
MFCFQKIIEERILEAQKRGDFDDLPGRGKPLVYEDDSHVPEELRLAYKILKNAGCVPPELELKKEILKLEDLMAGIPDEREKYRLMQRINYRVMKLNMMQHKSPLMEEAEFYYGKLMDKMSDK